MRSLHPRASWLARALLLTIWLSPAALAQNAPAGLPLTFPQVASIPVPLQSTSGRFSSLNPPNQLGCGDSRVTGRVVSPHLILVPSRMRMFRADGGDEYCGRGQERNVLVNIELSNPADARQMITGTPVVVTGTLKSAEEHRTAAFWADFLIMQKAELVAGDPRATPTPAFMSYMICQPQALDTLATQLGSELCVQSTILENLSATDTALETAARTLANVLPTDAVSGDSDAITCRPDPQRSDTHLPAIACARNSYWAWYRMKWGAPLDPETAPP